MTTKETSIITQRLREDFKQRFGELLGDLSVRKNRLALRKEMQSYGEVVRRKPILFIQNNNEKSE